MTIFPHLNPEAYYARQETPYHLERQLFHPDNIAIIAGIILIIGLLAR